MGPEGTQAARCVRCGLSIVTSGWVEALKQMGWVDVQVSQEVREKEPLVRPMLCPKCARAT